MSAKNSSSRKRSRPVEKKSMVKELGKNKFALGVILLIAVIIVAVVAIALTSNNNTEDRQGNPIAVIDTSMGTIKVELYEDKVPNTVNNFVKLANDRFYDGLVFHRVMDNFMIQGGHMLPDGTTKESPYGEIDLEINQEVRHVDGAISMARTNDPNSATSQFFICDGAQPNLDDSYAAFGVVIEGIDVVRDIADEPHDSSYGQVGGGKPLSDIIINSITIEK